MSVPGGAGGGRKAAAAAAKGRKAFCSAVSVNNVGSEYDEEQVRWLRACTAYQSRSGKSFLAATDYLRIARELGYRRCDEPPAP